MERKSLRLWRKIKLLVKVKLGLPTNKTRNKEDLIVNKDISSLEHTRWRCQYHVVFAPKYRRLAIYGELKQDIGYILRKLCERKGIEIVEASVPRSYPHADQHPTEAERIPSDGVPERKKFADDL